MVNSFDYRVQIYEKKWKWRKRYIPVAMPSSGSYESVTIFFPGRGWEGEGRKMVRRWVEDDR